MQNVTAEHSAQLKRRMKIMLIAVAILFGCVFIYKMIMKLFLDYYIANLSQVVYVSAMNANYSAWQPQLKASGSLRAIRGVDVTTSLAGMVQAIYFVPGSMVKEGDILVQLNADTEIGQLQALQAQAELAKITLARDEKQYRIHAVSKQTLDADVQNLKNLQGQVAEQAATVVKKTIRAPFSGRLGINKVNLGQYVNPGDMIVSLQTLDPIYADFYMPQQALAQLKINQDVTVIADAYPGKLFTGKITTINPAVDTATRNVEVEATIANPQYELAPGMFVSVDVNVGNPVNYITLPQTAITFNSYGDLVYVIKKQKNKKHKTVLIAHITFVKTGDTRGDQIAILSGVQQGDVVVTSGQLKLNNGSEVIIDNKLVPSNNPAPVLQEKE